MFFDPSQKALPPAYRYPTDGAPPPQSLFFPVPLAPQTPEVWAAVYRIVHVKTNKPAYYVHPPEAAQ